MRKDVKLGLAVGAVLFSVILVYLMTTGGDRDVARNGVDPGDLVVSPEAGTPARDNTDRPTGAPGDPADATNTTRTETPTDAAPSATGANWAALLSGTGAMPAAAVDHIPAVPVVERAPAPEPVAAPDRTTVAERATPPAPDGVIPSRPRPDEIPSPTADADTNRTDGTLAIPSRPATPPSFGPTTHVIQAGETFSRISVVVYGEAKYHTLIAKANPNVDPNRLKPGTSIILPARDSVIRPAPAPDRTPEVSPATRPAGDSYTVQSGDSLYSISKKIYGKDMVDKIYDLNKATIGADKTRLQIGMTLNLPPR